MTITIPSAQIGMLLPDNPGDVYHDSMARFPDFITLRVARDGARCVGNEKSAEWYFTEQ